MAIDATPPRPLPTVFDLLRPSRVELRAAPERLAVPRLGGRCGGRGAAEDDDDSPRMRRTLATTATSSGAADRLLFASSGSAYDCDRFAVVSGQPYTRSTSSSSTARAAPSSSS
jgi:hypothetical protein